MNGWIKVHRALAEHHVASDPSSLSVWIHLLLMANHREVKRQINGRVMVIAAGQLISSRKSISAKTGVNESKVERVLKMLQSEQLIEQRGTSKFRLISITNWAKYQLDEQESEQQENSKRTASEQQMNTPGEVIPGGITQEGEEGKEKNIGAQDKPGRKKSMGASDLIALGVQEQHAKDWMQVRKQKKAPLTQTALNATIREAGACGMSLDEAVRVCAERGWQGFKAEWMHSRNTANGQPRLSKQEQIQAANQRVVDEIIARQSAGGDQVDFDLGDPVVIEGEVIRAH